MNIESPAIIKIAKSYFKDFHENESDRVHKDKVIIEALFKTSQSILLAVWGGGSTNDYHGYFFEAYLWIMDEKEILKEYIDDDEEWEDLLERKHPLAYLTRGNEDYLIYNWKY